jgi:hypothetical protein
MRALRLLLIAAVFGWILLPVAAHASTTYTWVGNSMVPTADNHSWTDQGNWDPQGVPGDGDSVVIEQPGPGLCFAHVDAVPTVSLENFTLAEVPSLCTTSVSGGAITVNGLFQWNGGALNTPVTVPAGGVATVSGSNQRLNSLTDDLDVNGTLGLVGTDGAGALRISAGDALHIGPLGSLGSAGPNTIEGASCCVNPPLVRNEGTISINGGTLTMEAVQLDQLDTVATTLDGQLVTSDGPITTGTSGHYTGNGSWLIQTRAFPVFSGTQTLGQGFRLDFGGLSSVFSSQLTGSFTLAGNGTFAWTGGVIAANVTLAHTVTTEVLGAHAGGAQRVLKGMDFSVGSGTPVTFTNHGVLTVGNAATIATSSSAHLVNAADGVVRIQAGSGFSSQACCVAPDRLVNAGIVAVPSTPSGTPALLTEIAYQSTGITAISAGRTLQLDGGAPNVLTGGTVSGGGHLLLSAPTALNGTVHVGPNTSVEVAKFGSLDGNAALAGPGRFEWTGGSTSGALSLTPSGGIAIGGTDLKSVTTVGGGSTPSVVRLAAPTSIEAGTSQAHDLLGLGVSRLVLAAPTHAGAFTEFQGLLSNQARLNVGTGTIFPWTYQQPKTATLALNFGGPTHGLLSVLETAALRGVLRVHNNVAPRSRAHITVVKAHTLHASISCVATSGKKSTGSRAGHWAATHTGTSLILKWRRGAHTHC